MSRLRIVSFLGLLVPLVLSSACTRNNRLYRISPFSDQGRGERVNVWPLYYSSRGSHALLWPLLDWDARGFAVRPLVAREEDELSVLYPWSQFDLRTGHGWAAPFYHFEEHTGVFPIAHFGDLNYVGPIWWQSGGEGRDAYGVFPIALLSDTSYIGPFWWTEQGGRVQSGGLFPLAMFARFSYVGPYWWTAGSDGDAATGLFPLYSTGSLRHVGPVWWTVDGDGETRQGGFFPLVWFDEESNEVAVLPFYRQVLGSDRNLRQYLMGLGSFAERRHGHTRWILPFWVDHQEEAAAFEMLLPFYVQVREGPGWHTFTLLGDRYVEGQVEGFHLYPLYWSWASPHAETHLLLPFFMHEREGAKRTIITPLGGVALDGSGQAEFLNILGPVFHHSSAPGESRTAVLWPLIERHAVGERVSTRVFPFLGHASTPGRDEGWLLGGLGHYAVDHPQDALSYRLWPVFAYSSADELPGFLYDWTLFHAHVSETSTDLRFVPFFSGTSSPGVENYSWLLFTGQYRQVGDETSFRQWPLFSSWEGESLPSLFHYLSLYGRRETSRGVQQHFGTPAGLWHETVEEQDRRGSYARLLGLFTLHDEETEGAAIPHSSGTPQSEWLAANRISSSGGGFLFDWFCTQHDRYRRFTGLSAEDRVQLANHARTRREAEPLRPLLNRHADEPVADDIPVPADELEAFIADHVEEVDHWHHRIPFLFEYESRGDETEWDVLLWALHAREEPDESDFSLLYYLYRSQRKGARTTRDIFPFITYDDEGDDFSLSFLWRLFHLEREDDELGGHVLFIPF